MKELLSKISIEIECFKDNYHKTENKAAQRRARVSSLKIEKLLKEFRKESVK